MNDIRFATIKELLQALGSKTVGPEELIDATRTLFEQHDTEIGSALEIFDKDTIRKHTGAPSGPLYAIPGIHKDNICYTGAITSCASRILSSWRPPYTATALDRLLNAGAVTIGRANMDEFAMGSSTESSAFQKTKNPWNLECVPGGSSGGSAAAVAAGFVSWALGSDTGGSIRQPAAYCGVVGMKPTYGRVSRYGLVAYASSLDQIGPITRTVYDNALVLAQIAGLDPRDSTTRAEPTPDYTAQLTGSLPDGLTIGIIENEIDANHVDPAVLTCFEQALKLLEKKGATIKRISLPHINNTAATYFVVSRAEAASNLARYDGVQYGSRAEADTLSYMYLKTREMFGTEVKTRILLGNYVLSAGHADRYYHSAKKVQGLIRHDFLEAFKDVDLIVSPISSGTAFKLGAYDRDTFQMDLEDLWTASANLAGIPALALPCGFSDNNMPVGLQLIGPDLSESLLYQVGHAYEVETQWQIRRSSPG